MTEATLTPVSQSAVTPEAFFPEMRKGQLTIGGKTVTIETGRLARSAGASVLLTCEETTLFVTATASTEPRDGIDFFPLLVDFEERMYSVGRLPGGYLKREGRPSEKAILWGRLIDRPIRPLFPDGYRNDVQIVANAIASDSVSPFDTLAIFASSLALTLGKNIPFQGPVGSVRVGRVNGQMVINPTHAQLETSDLDLVVAGTADSIMMVEAGADFVSEADLLAALELAHKAIAEQVAFQISFAKECGVNKAPYVAPYDNAPLEKFMEDLAYDKLYKAFHENDREKRQEAVAAIKAEVKEAFAALAEDHALKTLMAAQPKSTFGECLKHIEKKAMRTMVLKEGLRADGRKPDEIRPILAQVGVVPRLHGTALFTRGGTQALSICTLGAPGDAQRLDGIDPATEKRWLHHYSFPAYSVGEVRPNRGAGRREIGHGALAERAIAPTLPSKEQFPYVLRVNSEVLESNGSTSMASTCGACLALMDAGVPIKTPIGGIAMGLIKEGNQMVILSDIQGLEDFLGDMDFKVTGSGQGITALQMDIKIQGISVALMKDALEQARIGRLHILGKMNEAIQTPRQELSKWAPRILSVKIDTDMIGTVIGPGGKMIRSIVEQTGATIDIEDDGTVLITSVSGEGGERALKIVQDLTRKIEAGQTLVGKVVSTIPIGAFVQLAPGRDGMIHISQFPKRVPSVEDAVNVGDDVLVRVIDLDERGRISLTMKDISNEERAEHGLEPFELPEFSEEDFAAAQKRRDDAPPRDRGPRRDGRGGGGGGRPGGGGGRGRF